VQQSGCNSEVARILEKQKRLQLSELFSDLHTVESGCFAFQGPHDAAFEVKILTF